MNDLPRFIDDLLRHVIEVVEPTTSTASSHAEVLVQRYLKHQLVAEIEINGLVECKEPALASCHDSSFTRAKI